MDVAKMLAELYAERQGIEEAILVVERLAAGGGKRRGRPPKWLSKHLVAEPAQANPPGKRVISGETRKRMAEAQAADSQDS